MIYAALLRGINVGGKNTVNMKALAAAFEGAGMRDVTTYINSGNVVFRTTMRSKAKLALTLEGAIESAFGFPVKVLLRDITSMRATVQAIPRTWVNDASMRTEVMFLWDEVNDASVLDELEVRKGIDEVRYIPGAILWRIDRANVNESKMSKLAGTPLYKRLTIRNCNTTRKVLSLMENLQS